MKITEKIHLLQIDFLITISPERSIPRFVNVLLLFGEKITLIDTGVKGSETLIFDYIREQGREIGEIERIILSHSHPDHIGSAAFIKEKINCKVFAHALEKDWTENIDLQNKERPVPRFFALVDRPVKIDEFISDGQKISIADDLTLKIIHSPGHSKGSVNILFVEDQILFTADSIPLKNDIPNYDNYHDLMKSLQKIKDNSDYRLLLSSWTPVILNTNEVYHLIAEGEQYMKKIDALVKENYMSSTVNTMDACKRTIEKLGLPPFLLNPLIDAAFQSHLK